MSKFSTVIKDIQLFPDGGAVLLCNPTQGNPKGNFRLNQGQVQRLAQRCGAFNAYGLKALIAFGGSKYEGESIERKAGDVWKNEKTGATGTIEKDHFATQNDSIALSMVANMKLADIVLTASVNSAIAGHVVAPVAQPKAEEPVATTTEPTV